MLPKGYKCLDVTSSLVYISRGGSRMPKLPCLDKLDNLEQSRMPKLPCSDKA